MNLENEIDESTARQPMIQPPVGANVFYDPLEFAVMIIHTTSTNSYEIKPLSISALDWEFMFYLVMQMFKLHSRIMSR